MWSLVNVHAGKPLLSGAQALVHADLNATTEIEEFAETSFDLSHLFVEVAETFACDFELKELQIYSPSGTQNSQRHVVSRPSTCASSLTLAPCRRKRQTINVFGRARVKGRGRPFHLQTFKNQL